MRMGEQCLFNLWINYFPESYIGAEAVCLFPSFADDDHDASDRFLIITDTCKTTLIGRH